MKIFISWSGDRSRHIALTFRHWLKRLSPALQPWMSSVDIQKGFSWDSSIAKELNKESKVGLICLTSDNLKSTYLHYEAGAISNVPNSNVYTFLYEIADTDVQQPLSQFQNTKFEKADILQLVRDINFKLREIGETSWSDEALDENFELLFPKLNEELRKTPAETAPKKKRGQEDLLEELLRTVRGLQSDTQNNNSYKQILKENVINKDLLLRKLVYAITEWQKESLISSADLFAYQGDIIEYVMPRLSLTSIHHSDINTAISLVQKLKS